MRAPLLKLVKERERVIGKATGKTSAKASENGKNSVQSNVAKQDETGSDDSNQGCARTCPRANGKVPGPNKENMADGDTGKVDGKKKSNKQKKGTHDGHGDGIYNEGEEKYKYFPGDVKGHL